jgi:SAM-dependent methyltransferase
MSVERLEPGTAAWTAFHANHLARYRFAVDALGSHAPGRILDAACGVSYGTRHLATSLHAQVVGVDRSTHALDIARRQFAVDGVEFLQDDCETLAAASARAPFDAVVTFETLEHLEHPARLLEGAARVLHPGGRLVASVPNGLVTPSDDWEFHLHDFDAVALERLVREAGFEHVQLYGQYLNAGGHLRQQMRAEIQQMRFNPLWRAGAWLQRVLGRGVPPGPPLPEQDEDFDFVEVDAARVTREGADGAFVLLATATR